jgi:hypothetical protein
VLFEGTWAERGFCNRLAQRVKQSFSLPQKSTDHSHIKPQDAPARANAGAGARGSAGVLPTLLASPLNLNLFLNLFLNM